MFSEPMTFGNLIAMLRGLPEDSVVNGLNGEVNSWRGNYKHVSTPPNNSRLRASTVAKLYESYLGETMTGWKGGDFPITEECEVYYAESGEVGASLSGLKLISEGVYSPSTSSIEE